MEIFFELLFCILPVGAGIFLLIFGIILALILAVFKVKDYEVKSKITLDDQKEIN
jgi:hypothetical protein